MAKVDFLWLSNSMSCTEVYRSNVFSQNELRRICRVAKFFFRATLGRAVSRTQSRMNGKPRHNEPQGIVMTRTETKLSNFEALEAKKMMTGDMGMDFVEAAEPEQAFIKSWSTSGDADDRPTEEVAFYYNKIAFAYSTTTDGQVFDNDGGMEWDNVKNIPWTDAEETAEVEVAEESAEDDASSVKERDYFLADSFSFGVEREMKESGEKGGTADLNIGVGELQECTVSKSMDSTSVDQLFGGQRDVPDVVPTEQFTFNFEEIK